MKSKCVPHAAAIASLLIGLTDAAALAQRAVGTASVSLSTVQPGEPKQLASGFIYGIPDNGTSASTAIPDYLYTGFGLTACRAGGAQIGAPSRGWAFGESEYIGRFNSTLSNYRTCRKYGADFVLLVHDVWGADSTNWEIIPYPGDKGDWSLSDQYIERLVADIKANDMLDGLILDVWNEPDGNIFWNRAFSQYTDYYVRASKQFRSLLPATRQSGPSMARSPIPNQSVWTQWFEKISAEKAWPDIFSWHSLDRGSDPQRDLGSFNDYRSTYSAPVLPIDVNEYGAGDEQSAPSSIWYMARFERNNIRGLRGHYGANLGLHDYMANVVGKYDNGSYFPNGDWQAYNYYTSMKGNRLQTVSAADDLFDVFAVKDGALVKILAGNRRNTDTYEIAVHGLSSIGLPSSGSVGIRTRRFYWTGQYSPVYTVDDLGVSSYKYSDDTVILTVTPNTIETAFAFEIDVVQPTTCVAQPKENGPVTNQPDTATAFLANQVYTDFANNASDPAKYTKVFSALTATTQQKGFIISKSLAVYDVQACAALCDKNQKCQAFNIYFQRAPTGKIAPGCTNPASQTRIACALYSTAIAANTATNRGETRGQFQVVSAGSNGYNKQT